MRSLVLTPLLMAALAAGCTGAQRPTGDTGGASTRGAVVSCDAEPLLPLVAFPEGPNEGIVDLDERDLTFAGTHELPDGFVRLDFARPDGDSLRVKARLPITDWPLVSGTRYRVAVEYIYGMPSLASLTIEDATGVVVAAAADQSLGGRVYRDGLPLEGVELALRSTDCPSRAHDRCFESIVNRELVVTTSEGATALTHGGQVDIGSLTLTCLVAQEADYASGCADQGVVAVSWMAVRRGE